MKVSLLDLAAQHAPLHQDIMGALERVVKSQGFILGPEVEEMEKQIAGYCGAKFGVGVSSGTDALLVALMAYGIGDGDEVVTTPFTFFATGGVIARLGAKPVFVDIDPVTFNMNPKLIGPAVSPNTKAIIPVHLFGQCADMDPILELGRKKGIPVIEDAAQAIGSQYLGGKSAGAMGEMGCLSFFPSKNLGALGDGGLVLTNDVALAEKLKILRVHGAKPKYYHKWVGGNFRIDALQAAVLQVKLKYLDQWTKARQENARRYDAMFQASQLIEREELKIPQKVYEREGFPRHHIYNQYVVRVMSRDKLMEFLKSKNIGVEVYYPLPLHLQECFKDLGHKEGDFPESEKASQEALALPVYPGLTVEMQEYVVKSIEEFYSR